MTATEILSLTVGVIGCLVGLSGWLRDTKGDSATDAEWRGQISAKLDSIIANVTGQGRDIERLDTRLNALSERMATVEASAKQAHKRLDQMQGEGGV